MMKLVSVKGSLKRLEPYDGKLSRTVLRGREDSNISPVTRHDFQMLLHCLLANTIDYYRFSTPQSRAGQIAP